MAGFQVAYLSTDGQNFNSVSMMHADWHSVAFSPFTNNEIFLGGDGGIQHSSTGGSSWHWDYPNNLNNDLGISESYHVASSIYNEDIILCGLQDEGVAKKYAGVTTFWSNTGINYGDGTAIIYSPFKSNISLASYCIYDRPIFYSSDNSTFTLSNVGTYNGQRSTLITPFAAHPKTPGIFYNARNVGMGTPNQIRFYTSTDDGHTFTDITFQLEGLDEGTPQTLAISPSNPDFIAFSIGDYSDYWNRLNQIYKSTNGGATFNKVQTVHPDVPNKYFTHIEFDPTDENIIYLTVSGFDEGHVFRTTNGGNNWENLSGITPNGVLPNAPANDLIIRYPDATSKDLIVATDEGVWRADANSTPSTISWTFLATDLPNTHIIDLDYNRLSNKLRASAFGRGIWEVNLPGDIYVQDELYITDNTSIDKNIIVCSGGKLNLGYQGFSAFNISMENGAKIIVQDGGYLKANTDNQFTITSQSQWGGIEFQGTGYGSLNNVTFSNTNTPISIVQGNLKPGSQHTININGCHFNEGYVSIDNRSYVNVQSCYWNYSNSLSLSVTGIISIGSDVITIQENHITPSIEQTDAGISVVYGRDISIVNNEISNVDVGIMVSNTSPYISRNILSHSSKGLAGMGFDNSYTAIVSDNIITGYDEGFKLGASSPVMYNNSSNYNEGTVALTASYYSSPRLRPLVSDDGELIIDAGYNTLRTNQSGMNINGLSIPDIEDGCNTIYGQDRYDIEGIIGYMYIYYYAAFHNDWVNNPPIDKFDVVDAYIDYDPYGCPQGGPGGDNYNLTTPDVLNPDPPQPIIVNRGNGFYDTIQVKSTQLNLSLDKMLYSQASKQELLGNYTQAISLYQQVIANYQDSISAIEAMRKIIECYEKNSADSSSYSLLRSYYLNLIQSHSSDITFVKAAKELASKSLVRKRLYPDAINEYENIVFNSTDSLEILYNELNVIETYMLIEQTGGDNPSFTGKLSYLRPTNHKAGLDMIRKKLYKIGSIKNNKTIPNVYSLSQNYPNPFNPLTKINYSLPQGTKVSIKIYDVLGKLVKELVNEYKDAGNYTVTFDGSNFASGVYFYKIEAGAFVDAKKMVLIK
jgi:tetratricopeptide (TPR) repeat protein